MTEHRITSKGYCTCGKHPSNATSCTDPQCPCKPKEKARKEFAPVELVTRQDIERRRR
jgi:hypothetical protein